MSVPAASPFKHDEPVSSSRKWMVLTVTALVIGAVSQVVDAFQQSYFNIITLWWTIAIVSGLTLLISSVCRVVQLAGQCRQHRNFEMMASAVRAQRPVWVLSLVLAAFIAVTLVVLSIQMRPRMEAIQEMIDRYRAEQQAARSAVP